MSGRENAASKARRYLAEGRIVVERVDARSVVAVARGDGERHHVTWRRSGGWSCTCPARGRCCHLQAVGLVVAVDLSSTDGRP